MMRGLSANDQTSRRMDDFLKPASAAELTAFLIHVGLMRAYFDTVDEARRKRLTENDIAVIERRALGVIAESVVAADEFPDFEMEKAVADAKAGLRELFDHGRKARLGKG
jgi:hypothetical protein